jgi:hypothetical protein
VEEVAEVAAEEAVNQAPEAEENIREVTKVTDNNNN